MKTAPRDTRHLFFAGVCNRADSRNGAASADGRTRADQECRFFPDMKQIAEPKTHQHHRSDAHGGVEKARTSSLKNLMQVHAKAEGNDGGLQQKFRQALAFDVKGMSHNESIDQTA